MKRVLIALATMLTFALLGTMALGTVAAGGAASINPSLPVVKIGAAGPYTGDVAKIGLDGLNAIRMAVEEANAAGGINGRRIEIVEADDAADPSKAILVAEKLAMDRAVLGVVGPMNSATAQAALPTYQRAGLAILSQSATYPPLTEMGYNVMFRLCPRDDSQGPASAKFIVEQLKAKHVYIIDDKTTYGQGLSDQVEAALKKAGVRVTRGQITMEDRDFAPILTRVRAAAPDLLYLGLANPAQAAAILKQAAGLGIKLPLMGGDGLKEQDQLIEGSAGLAEGMYVTSIGKDVREVPEARAFIEKFEARYGALSVFGGQTYEATNILIAAMRRASADPTKLTRANVMQALAATSNYKGILGFPISFDSRGDVVGARIYVYQVKKGEFVAVADYLAEVAR
jgi:branched-chain amino acid transport system substrate-binding protein